jgi:hypothetical protein
VAAVNPSKWKGCMTDLLLGGMLPRRWRWDPIKVPFVEIIVDWQLIELDPKAEIGMPLLREIQGHRRREIMDWFEETGPHRDVWIAEMYGHPGSCI